MRIPLFVLTLLFTAYDFAETITGKVVSVADGDTITILDSAKKQTKIRFEHIDTPESGQAFGQKAKSYLSGLIFGKQVKVIVKGKDRYGRSIGSVYLGSKNINLAMVQAGYAWHFKKHSKDAAFAKTEKLAKAKKLGLWKDKNAMPPWEYRAMR